MLKSSKASFLLVITLIMMMLCLIVVIGFLGYYYRPKPVVILKQGDFPLTTHWKFEADEEINTIAVAKDRLIVGTSTWIYRLDSYSGNVIWKKETGIGSDRHALRMGNKDIYFVDSDNLYSMDVDNGRIHWQTELISMGARLSALSSKHVYVTQTSWTVGAYDVDYGHLDWDVPSGRGNPEVYVDEMENTAFILNSPFLIAYDELDGSFFWETPMKSRGESVYSAGILYVNSVDEQKESIIRAYDTRRQIDLWEIKLFEEVTDMTYHSGTIFATTESGIATLDAHNGSRIWIVPITAKHLSTPLFLKDIVYLRDVFAGNIHAVDAKTGQYLGNIIVETQSIIGLPHDDYTRELYGNGENLFYYVRNRLYCFGE